MIEDLTVRNMVKNHRLARAISDAAWTELRTMLEYKCAWYGRELIVVDRWFPSSRAVRGLRHRPGEAAAERPHVDVRLRHGP